MVLHAGHVIDGFRHTSLVIVSDDYSPGVWSL